MTTLHDFSARLLGNEQAMSLSGYKGKVLLVVNTASQCGLTPQYGGLEALHKQFAACGFAVLGFPCNQFGAQEPGSAQEIGAFCEKNYGVSFPMFDKVEVNGPGAHPLYQWLTQSTDGAPIKWNFGKFLIGRDGALVKRYEPQVEPAAIVADVEKLLA